MDTNHQIHPGNANEAKSLEKFVIHQLSQQERIVPALTSKSLKINSEFSVQIDGYSENAKVLCEAWAHMGAPKPAQKSKVMKDALKLIFIEKSLGKKFKKIIVFADEEARRPFVADGWMAACLKSFDVRCELIEVPVEMRNTVMEAQKRQYR